MSWQENRGPGRQSLSVTAQGLEERINMYISAMDKASAMNNPQQSSQLQRDIQLLVDLMEKVSAGQVVAESEVPPPLDITPQNDILANPLGELSSRMSEYHKALYFAEEELSDQRINKIKSLQKGLQVMHTLQKRAQDGFPVRADEIPPPVVIPSDEEFDNDAVNTIVTRISQYKRVLMSAQTGSEADRRKIPKIQSGIRTLEFLLTRAKARRPVWKTDIPPEFEYYGADDAEDYDRSVNKAKIVLQVRSLLVRCSKIQLKDEGKLKAFHNLQQNLRDIDKALSSSPSHGELKKFNTGLMKLKMEVDSMEKLSESENALTQGSEERKIQKRAEDLSLLELRIDEYKTAALTAKRENHVEHAIKHFKVLKGLQALKEQLQKGAEVDMTQVPPPPPVFTPVSETQPQLPNFKDGLAGPGMNGATAGLSPVSIRPPVETAEDRLAKQLSSYLDEGNAASLTGSRVEGTTQQANVAVTKEENTPVVQQSSQNSAVLDGVRSNTSRSLSLDEIGMVSCGEGQVDPGSGARPKQGQSTEMSPVAEGEGSSAQTAESQISSQNPSQIPSSPSAEMAVNPVVSATESTKDDAKVASIEGKEDGNGGNVPSSEFPTACVDETPAAKELPKSPPRTSEIYNRKTLDSVGFLSCQNVPQSTQNQMSVNEKPAFVPSAEMVLEQESEVKSSAEELPSPGTRSGEVSKNSSGAGETGTIDVSGREKTFANSEDTMVAALPSGNDGSYSLSADGVERNSPVVSNNQLDKILPPTVDQVAAVHQQGAEFASLPPMVRGHENNVPPDSPPDSLPNFQFDNSRQVQQVVKQPDSLSTPPDITGEVSARETLPIQDKALEGHQSPDLPAGSDLAPVQPNEFNNSSQVQPPVAPSTGLTISETTSKSRQFESPNESHAAVDDLEFQDLMESMSMPDMSSQVAPPVANHSSVQSGTDKSASSNSHSLSALTGTPISSEREKPRVDNSSLNTSTLPSSNQNVTTSEQSTWKNNSVRSDSENFGTNQTQFSSLPPVLSSSLTQEQQNKLPHESLTQPQAPAVSVQSGDQTQHLYSLRHGSPLTNRSSKFLPSTLQNVQGFESVDNASVNKGSSGSEVTLRCLENLKYDFLLAEARNLHDEAEKLKVHMSKIKTKLREGGRQIWDVYKLCVQSELAATEKNMEDMRRTQQWDEVQLLSQKKTLAERELAVLRVRLLELRY